MVCSFVSYYKNIKQRAVIKVGVKATLNNVTDDIPLQKKRFNIDWPTGFGALAIMVNPPPVIAPLTMAYFRES